MNYTEQHPTLFQRDHDSHLDYYEMYRSQEVKQLNKRLRKTRNILLICAVSLVGGAGLFWSMPETSFDTNDFLLYVAVAAGIALLSLCSSKQPYFSILSALITCIGFWGFEMLMNSYDDLLIEGAIQKLFITSLLISCFHSSREAELIRKELHFS